MPVLTATKTLGVGLSGCGDIATKGHANLFADAGYALRAAFNPTASKAAAVVDSFGGQVVDGFGALIERDDVDVVVITAPPLVHAAQCCAALRAGKHVLCEKPSALDLAENAAIERAQAESGRTVAFCSSRLRHGGFTRNARAYLEQGRLGRIYRVEIAFAHRTFKWRNNASANAAVMLAACWSIAPSFWVKIIWQFAPIFSQASSKPFFTACQNGLDADEWWVKTMFSGSAATAVASPALRAAVMVSNLSFDMVRNSSLG